MLCISDRLDSEIMCDVFICHKKVHVCEMCLYYEIFIFFICFKSVIKISEIINFYAYTFS